MPEDIFKVQIVGLDKLVAALKNAPGITKPTLNSAIQKAQAVLAKHTTRGVVPWKTGNLVQTFMATFGDLMANWQPTAAYAPYVQFGHSQQPGRFVPALGKRLVASSVAAKPFMQQIVEASQGELDSLFIQALTVITADIAKSAQ